MCTHTLLCCCTYTIVYIYIAITTQTCLIIILSPLFILFDLDIPDATEAGTAPIELGKVESVVISVILTAVVSLVVGGVLGATIMYFVMKKKSQKHSPSDDVKIGALYEEVTAPKDTMAMEENVSYGPVKGSK